MLTVIGVYKRVIRHFEYADIVFDDGTHIHIAERDPKIDSVNSPFYVERGDVCIVRRTKNGSAILQNMTIQH